MATWTYPASWTDICNQALALLGTELIANVSTDTTQNAVYARLFLGDAIDAVAGAYEWRNLTKRATLALLSETPEFDFDYAYQLPTDFVRLVSLNVDGDDYSLEQDQVLTSADEAELVYVARPEDPTKLSPLLRRAIQTKLAELLAMPITSSDQLAIRIGTVASMALTEAIAEDGKRRQPETVADELGFTWSDELR